MTPAVHRPDPRPAGEFESRLAAYRTQVTPYVLQAIPQREPRRHLYDLIAGQLSREGKGIRPALCIATCRAFGGSAERALPSAAALELLHNGFLVHDDIEDSSEYRRDQPTLHLQHGVPLAVNTGDALNAMSLQMLRRNLPLLGPDLTWQIFDEFDHMMMETIEGQAMELGWIRENNCETTEKDYLHLVLKKTCWYSFIHPARIGAMIAGRDRTDLSGFDRFGFFLGTAFQIQDDVLNLIGDRKKYGKEIGGDLLEGKRTLILAHLFRQCSATDRQRLRTFFGQARAERQLSEVAWVQESLHRYGSIEYARQVARDFAQAAGREFENAYREAPAGDDLVFLRALLDYMVTRDQ
jgi:geranylgeranyl diphosphate synthase type II